MLSIFEITKPLTFLGKRSLAKKEIKNFVQKLIQDLTAQVTALAALTDYLQGENYTADHGSKLQALLRDFEALPFKEIPRFLKRDRYYKLVQDECKKLYAADYNLEATFLRYNAVITKTATVIGEQNSKMLAYSDKLLSDVRNKRIVASEVEFVKGFDFIMKNWQDASPERDTLSGIAINPDFLDKNVYSPFGELYRQNASLDRALEIMPIVREFSVSFSERNNARELFLREINAASKQIEDVRVVLWMYFDKL